MLKKRDLNEASALYELIKHPDVFPYVRQKAQSYEEFLFLTKQLIEKEEQGELISRTILNEWMEPIGTITLYDIKDHYGFLGTWIGKPYHGKGYNHLAKEAFFKELFFHLGIEHVYLRIRKQNIRSQKAAEKLPYVIKVDEDRLVNFAEIDPEIFVLYEVPKDLFTLYAMRIEDYMNSSERLEA